jgi:putative transcriptional regulator
VTVTHHLDEATIVAFAAGTLGEAHRIAAAGHMAFCPACRAGRDAWERIGGTLLAESGEATISEACRKATLARLDAFRPEWPRPSHVRNENAAAAQRDVPAVLCNLIGNRRLEDVRWRKVAPGVAVHVVPLSPATPTRLTLFRLAPGCRLPEHGHGGSELTLVLRGSYTDQTGRYVRGDIADLDEATEHQPVVDDGETCYCLFATEAPARFKSRLLRLLQPLLGF